MLSFSKWTSIGLAAFPALACGSADVGTDTIASSSAAIQATSTLAEFSVSGAAQGTFAVSANLAGVATGYWVDANTVYHGFVRESDGTIKTFDAPGSGSTPGASVGTVAYAVNLEGTIAGEFQGSDLVYHSFIRSPNGTFTKFDVPAAGAGANQGTLAANINSCGEVAGYYVDASGIAHGFTRAPGGEISTFDAPRTSQIGLFVALESGLSDVGVTTGYYYDEASVVHAFVHAPGGEVQSFDAPSARGAGANGGTYGGSINLEGSIAGGVLDASGVYHGFVRSPAGVIVEFQAPAAGTAANTPGAGTFAVGIGLSGETAGYFFDNNSAVHGFSRSPNGAFSIINARGAISKTPDEGTIGEGISPIGGFVPGYYFDVDGLAHGFVWSP